DSIEVRSSVRWFEDWFSLTPVWRDECFVNHSFTPAALWHLGFVFALDTLRAATEVTLDSRDVIGAGEQMQDDDSVTGRPMVRLPWNDCSRQSAEQLARLHPP